MYLIVCYGHFIFIQLSLLFSKRVQRISGSWDGVGVRMGERGGVWERGRGEPAHGAWLAELTQGSSKISSFFHKLFRITDYKMYLLNINKI